MNRYQRRLVANLESFITDILHLKRCLQDHQQVIWEISETDFPVVSDPVAIEPAAIGHFATSSFSDGDAAFLSQLWGVDLIEAKERIGRSCADSGEAPVETLLQKEGYKAYADTHSYPGSDVTVLAKFWNIEEAAASMRLGREYASGGDAVIRELLKNARIMNACYASAW